jgi:methyl-CpG-binding domain protein 4
LDSYVAPVSPHDLIQEHYPGDEYKILVCCILLNQTRRKQLDKIVDEFFDKWPTAESILCADHESLVEMMRPLGFYNRRAKSLKKFAEQYIAGNWNIASDLHGCGKYANDAWMIFIKGRAHEVSPEDHALNHYHSWFISNHKSV